VTDEPLGSHVLELQVADVVVETDDARSLVFAVPDGADIPADRLRYAPGQFLTLRVPSDRTGSVARCYSLCSSPHTGDPLTVTVKRTDGGYASHWLCDNAHPSFLGRADATESGTRRAYDPDTYRSLQAVKAKYDPHNVFRTNLNILPDTGV